MSVRVVYDTMLFLQAAVQPIRVHRSFQAVREGLVTLMLKLASESSESGALLRRLVPQLRIVNPEQFAYVLKAL